MYWWSVPYTWLPWSCENIREATLEGLNAAARKGNHGGRPPVITAAGGPRTAAEAAGAAVAAVASGANSTPAGHGRAREARAGRRPVRAVLMVIPPAERPRDLGLLQAVGV